jgi:2-polyprenyl-3-methyl-5-hydroxy-6-metoxy-1,4-benzoquinol methylase
MIFEEICKMEDDRTYCKACGNNLDKICINSYSFCPFCESANYISDRNAEDDNREYFNSVYSSNAYSRVIEKRLRLFEKCEYLYVRIHKKSTRSFNLLLKKISELIVGAGKAVEIGFGNGVEMIRFLKAGANIYGLDISEKAIENFKLKYPEYSTRVYYLDRYDSQVDIVYSNALFEHLDNPDHFLANAFSMLSSGGLLIMRIPLITGTLKKDSVDTDINFWKPCHRILYTLKGLAIILEKHGFKISESAALDYYGYNVMSRMRRLGYEDIVHVRNPYVAMDSLQSDLIYTNILIKSLFESAVCSDFALIAMKVN